MSSSVDSGCCAAFARAVSRSIAKETLPTVSTYRRETQPGAEIVPREGVEHPDATQGLAAVPSPLEPVGHKLIIAGGRDCRPLDIGNATPRVP